MTANFIIENHYAFVFQGKHLDIHNEFDFTGFSFDGVQRKLVLEWVEFPRGNRSIIRLTVFEVNYLKILPRDKEMPYTEDSCVMHMGYYPSASRDEDESLMIQEQPLPGDDIIFTFQSEMILRAGGSRIELTLI